jgi:hypothetical protein
MRKQVFDLTLADLADSPAWEFAQDEDHLPNQDEATVRPFSTEGLAVPDGGMFVVRTTFTLEDTSQQKGYVYYTPRIPSDIGPNYGELAHLQPNIVTAKGQVMFWLGRFQPTGEVLRDFYEKLGKGAPSVFPISFSTDVPLETGPINGTIRGFSYLTYRKKGWFGKETIVEEIR